MNYSDAERIATVMDLLGYKKTEKEDEADVIITVACSVRQTAIDRIYGKTRDWNKKRLKNSNFKTILSGCVLPEDRKKMEKSFDLIFEIDEMEKLANFLAPKKEISDLGGEYLSVMPQRESSFRAFVPIMTGCNNFCSYCAVPYTRGREKSRPQKEVIGEVKELIKKGYKEIHLLGQNVNSYANDFGDLLKKIDAIPGEWRGYFYSNHPKDFSDELIGKIADLKHFPHYIHLPLQSGDNKILKSMNRNYTKREYLELVDKIRKIMPDVVLTTDIIVGYPGEGEKEFSETVEVVKKVKFEMIFIGKYSPRSGTKSAKLTDDVSSDTKKYRDEYLTKLLGDNLEKVNSKFVGQTLGALIDEKKPARHPDGGKKYYGRTEGYKVVEIKTDQPFGLGQFVEVEITGSTAWKLFGEII
jgi:tRNA-2-methylthio-N6-dimethylallyladenosine synthase